MPMDQTLTVLTVALCLMLGGVLKGATGAGAPLLAVPALALLFDVRFAIIVMLVPNMMTNIWQGWKFRQHIPETTFMVPLLIGSVAGVLLGTYLLATVPLTVLPLFLAAAVFGYVALRLSRPDWVLGMPQAKRLALPVGTLAGVLQGASGISAPVSITFLNAIRLPRPVFIATISLFFAAFGVFQLLALWGSGVADAHGLLISLFALAPIAAGMPIGAQIAKRVSPAVFDKAILVLLSLIAVRLVLGYFG
ncbi:MAG: sulfite exporter TauE/SafE family protein [Marinosulfonomonas sp.]